MSWRVAGCLETLRAQIDAAWPGRNRASDGTIGDAAHQASVSDHNPDAAGVVRALDITHDPSHGCDIDALSDALVANRESRISYIIANRLITGPDYGWEWAPYDGEDPHTNHLHLSVVADSRADDRRMWNIGTGGDDDMALSDSDKRWIAQNVANAVGRGTWELGYVDRTFDPGYRPTAVAPLPNLATVVGQVAGLSGEVRALAAAFAALAAGGTSVDTSAVLTAVAGVRDLVVREREAELAAAIAEVEARTHDGSGS